jgi:hypothetical protein
VAKRRGDEGFEGAPLPPDCPVFDCPGIRTAFSDRLARLRSAAIAVSALTSRSVRTDRSTPRFWRTKL